MRDFKDSNFRGRSPSGRRFEDRGPKRFERRENFGKRKYEVTCDECGKQCEVPFKPIQDKPIYCDECFRKGDNSDSKGSTQSKSELDKINKKLDRILELLEMD